MALHIVRCMHCPAIKTCLISSCKKITTQQAGRQPLAHYPASQLRAAPAHLAQQLLGNSTSCHTPNCLARAAAAAARHLRQETTRLVRRKMLALWGDTQVPPSSQCLTAD